MARAQPAEYRCPTVRSAKRINFKAVVQFRSGSRRADVRVLDVSTEGARISAIHSLREGDRFYLKLPMIEAVEATVAWARDFELGCRFARPLHPAVLETLITAA